MFRAAGEFAVDPRSVARDQSLAGAVARRAGDERAASRRLHPGLLRGERSPGASDTQVPIAARQEQHTFPVSAVYSRHRSSHLTARQYNHL